MDNRVETTTQSPSPHHRTTPQNTATESPPAPPRLPRQNHHPCLDKILSHHETMTSEMNRQLEIIQDLYDEKAETTRRLTKCRREVELLLKRDGLNASRNAALATKAEAQGRKIDELSRELVGVRERYEGEAEGREASFVEVMEGMVRTVERKKELLMKKNVQMDRLQKRIERLTGRRDFLEGFLADAIVQTMAEKRRGVDRGSDMISRAMFSSSNLDELANLNIENLKLEDYKCIFRHFLCYINERKAALEKRIIE